MGNCLKGTSNEDISLLRGNEGSSDNQNDVIQPPPYRVSDLNMRRRFTFSLLHSILIKKKNYCLILFRKEYLFIIPLQMIEDLLTSCLKKNRSEQLGVLDLWNISLFQPTMTLLIKIKSKNLNFIPPFLFNGKSFSCSTWQTNRMKTVYNIGNHSN